MEMTLVKFYASLQLVPAILAGRWWWVIAAIAATALFGRRVYCRFVCPLGIAQSLVRLCLGRRRICSRLDGAGRAGQWTVRIAILVAAVAVGVLGFGWQWIDPYAIASRAACWFTSPELEKAVALFALVPAGAVLVLAVVAGGRIWCNWVCPLGTLLALFGIRPWKGDRVKKRSGCDKCGRCFR